MAAASTLLPILPSSPLHLLHRPRHNLPLPHLIPRRTLTHSAPSFAPSITSSTARGGPRARSAGKPPPLPARKKRGAYGTSRRSILKKSFSQEQVDFTSPVSANPVVGIIGGGASGLACAMALEEHGIRCTVFDTVCVRSSF